MADIGSICIYCGSSLGHDSRFREGAATLGRLIAEAGVELVFGGARIGLMGVLAGAEKGPDGESVPNITPHPKHGIGRWSAAEVVELLKTGTLPDGDMVDSPMDDVVDNDTSHWTDDDLKAAAEFLLSSPAPGKDNVRWPVSAPRSRK